MWVRAAYYVGRIKPGMETRFREGVDGRMIPGIKALPGVRSARALWPQRREEGAPELACQILVEFDGQGGVDLMLASSERQALRAQVGEINALFEGKVSHIDTEVG